MDMHSTNSLPTFLANLPPLRKPRAGKREPLPAEVNRRYIEAHHRFTEGKSPEFFRLSGGEDMAVNLPDTRKSNGLTSYILNFLIWQGHRATRINVAGRLIHGDQKQASGVKIKVKKFLRSSTRQGSADVSSTIFGKSVMWEVKTGADTPSEFQLAEQALEIAAGGKYYFVKTAMEFLTLYDQL